MSTNRNVTAFHGVPGDMSEQLRIEPGTPAELADAISIDDDATALYARHGVLVELPPGHPFVAAEQQRWRRCAEAGGLWFAARGGERVGFAALGHKDGGRYLDQLSVRCAAQGKGVGGALLEHVQRIAAAEQASLLLTTYEHLPWNAPFYERRGFRRLREEELGPGLRAALDFERAALPLPERRIALRWEPGNWSGLQAGRGAGLKPGAGTCEPGNEEGKPSAEGSKRDETSPRQRA